MEDVQIPLGLHSTFFLNYNTIQAPKPGVAHYDECYKSFLLGVFNETQSESGKPTISNFTISTWLKKFRPKHAIYPHQLDYCDTCAAIKHEIQSKQTTLNRMRQNTRSSTAELQQLQQDIDRLGSELSKHREAARKSYDSYNASIARCREQWKKLRN